MQNIASNSILKPDVPEFIPKNSRSIIRSDNAFSYILAKHQETILGRVNKTHTEGIASSKDCNSSDNINRDLNEVDFLQEQMKLQQNALDQRKLEVQVKQLESTTKNLQGSNTAKESRIKYLERCFMTHWSHSFFSECNMISKHMGKCEKVIADLKLVSEYLTQETVPSLDQCKLSICKWEDQYKMESDYLQKITKHYHEVASAIQSENDVLPYVNIERPSNINDLQDILHDNFLSTFKSLLNLQNQSTVQIPNVCFQRPPVASNDVCVEGSSVVQREVEEPTKLQNEHSDLRRDQIFVFGGVKDEPLPSKQNVASVSSQTGDTDVSENSENYIKISSSASRWRQIPQEDIVNATPLLCCKPDVSGLPEELQKKFQYRKPSFFVNSVYNPKFIEIFTFIKKNITGVSDEEILFALKSARKKIKYLSVMPKDNVLSVVIEELRNITDSYGSPHMKIEHVMCVICFHPFGEESKTRLICKHIYHTTCITTYFQTDCPLCILRSHQY
ncbi:hypothetical protein RI129_007401 [Pyrocoelia pectoralis]|uniref:RING-type domain-containing protein n=1 Tax=Pyrocoelia pectoralis TaxID=417401 RepID=A0AAN7VDJ1_9COLE